jgi:arabinose-5-phosphate isomerase
MQAGNPEKLDNRQAAIESALRTVATEQAGLAALVAAFANGLAKPFADAVHIISALAGRVVVTGVGKSHHIGSKIAATLASTGTPAFFVHPAEANHGDLGMITRDDAILALSWSGESAELQGIVRYSRRFKIPLIAVTSNEASTLGREADVVLALPKVAEACPHGLAPTTSTLMQLAIGDALAVALLEAKGFTPNNFRDYHPGGKLGASLMHLSEMMRTGDAIPTVPLGTRMPDAAMVLSNKKVGCVLVVESDGRLAGIVTDGDVARNMQRNLRDIAVEEIMTRSPKTVAPSMSAGAAVAYLNENKIGVLVVVEESRPVGVVHFHDLLRIGAA